MVRFFLMWIFISSVIGGFMYLANKLERKKIRNVGLKVVISAGLGLLFASSLMALNHVQGV